MYTTFIQYVGNSSTGYMVFVEVSNHYLDKNEMRITATSVTKDIKLMSNSEFIITPIDPSQYEYWINNWPDSDRIELYDRGDFFEYVRHDHSSHISGYKLIKLLKVGEIIPARGFVTPEAMSDTDKYVTGDPKRFKAALLKSRKEKNEYK